MTASIEIEKQAHDVYRLTLARPEVHNAFDDTVINALSEALKEIALASPRVLVLQAKGKSFSAGADLNWMKKSASYSVEENRTDARALAGMLNQLNSFPCPTIASVQGAALGGGVGLVACCDIALASTTAIFGLTEVRLGLIPATISPFVLQAIGARQARRYFASAERFDAQTAQRIGLVHEVVAVDSLPATTDELITQLLQSSPDAQKKARDLIDEIAPRSSNIDDKLLDDTANAIADARASAEGREGISAFLEKRKPSWVPS